MKKLLNLICLGCMLVGCASYEPIDDYIKTQVNKPITESKLLKTYGYPISKFDMDGATVLIYEVYGVTLGAVGSTGYTGYTTDAFGYQHTPQYYTASINSCKVRFVIKKHILSSINYRGPGCTITAVKNFFNLEASIWDS